MEQDRKDKHCGIFGCEEFARRLADQLVGYLDQGRQMASAVICVVGKERQRTNLKYVSYGAER